MTNNILIAGFGGQGVLFTGKYIAYDGMLEGKEVSWLPSYGPEMRGGTCNCSVILSDTPVGSPIVNTPDVLIAMNLPSLDKFEKSVTAGGSVFVDSSLIERKINRTDVKVYYIPATQIASDNNIPTLTNMIMLGKVMKECPVITRTNVERTLKKIVSAKKQDLIDLNIKAIDLGYNA